MRASSCAAAAQESQAVSDEESNEEGLTKEEMIQKTEKDTEDMISIKEELEKMQLVCSTWQLPSNKYTDTLISDVDKFITTLTMLHSQLVHYIQGHFGNHPDDYHWVLKTFRSDYEDISKEFVDLKTFAENLTKEPTRSLKRHISDPSDDSK